MSEGKGAYRVALADSDAAAGIVSLANPEGADVIIPVGGLVLDVATVATGACTVDVGIDADGTGSSDTLLDGVDANAAVAIFSNAAARKWGANQFLTASKATGAAAGLVGHLYVSYIRE